MNVLKLHIAIEAGNTANISQQRVSKRWKKWFPKFNGNIKELIMKLET